MVDSILPDSPAALAPSRGTLSTPLGEHGDVADHAPLESDPESQCVCSSSWRATMSRIARGAISASHESVTSQCRNVLGHMMRRRCVQSKAVEILPRVLEHDSGEVARIGPSGLPVSAFTEGLL